MPSVLLREETFWEALLNQLAGTRWEESGESPLLWAALFRFRKVGGSQLIQTCYAPCFLTVVMSAPNQSPWAKAGTGDPTSQFISIYPQSSHLQLSNLTAQAPDLPSKPLGSSSMKPCAPTVEPSLQPATLLSL